LGLSNVWSRNAPVSQSSIAAAPNPDSARVVLVDVVRVLAIVFMIQGHALDVLLAPAYRQSLAYDVWLFLRGLTAPTFFILSGASFTLATMRHWENYVQPSWKLLRRLVRFSFFVCLGYAMHLPAASLRDFQFVDAAGWLAWFQADVLQCIGLTLIGLQCLVLCASTPARLAWWSGVAGAVVVLLTPLTWAADWTVLVPLPIAPYFNGHTGSYFPLFPWAGYVLFGAALGYHFRQWSVTPERPVRLLVAGGAVLGLAGVALVRPLVSLYGNLDFWKTSPSQFLIRAGCVCLLFAFFARVTSRFRLPVRTFRALSEESLLIYFVHLCILYGSVWNPGLRQMVGATLAPLPTLGGVALLVLAMLLLGWTWNSFKRAEPRRSYVLRFAVWLVAISVLGLR
jgi:uncharacterized membrane protein